MYRERSYGRIICIYHIIYIIYHVICDIYRPRLRRTQWNAFLCTFREVTEWLVVTPGCCRAVLCQQRVQQLSRGVFSYCGSASIKSIERRMFKHFQTWNREQNHTIEIVKCTAHSEYFISLHCRIVCVCVWSHYRVAKCFLFIDCGHKVWRNHWPRDFTLFIIFSFRRCGKPSGRM